jgi:hypothetical protein
LHEIAQKSRSFEVISFKFEIRETNGDAYLVAFFLAFHWEGLSPHLNILLDPEQSGGKITFRTEYKEGERKRAKTTRRKKERKRYIRAGPAASK